MSSNYYVSGTTGTTKYYPNPYYDKTNIWPFPAEEWDDTLI